ncbi:autophagy protein [Plectosphaerella plurivora]|uniref:Autophagy protein n=1 Tax=Plectosphaerella plurivora TaxID=936078 RepID=A0A9P9A796_9PEZI|nr:autophagy protein [Plectosphaerella plurivora]
MAGWRDEYLASIREQERNNPVNLELVDLCSQLADRVAALEAEKVVLASRIKASTASNKKGETPPPQAPTGDDPGLAQLNFDLAEALRAKGTLQTRVKKAEDELADLRNKTKSDARLLKDITAERSTLATKLKDREYELREKRKLVEDVQDEMISLNLQVHMAEQQRDKARKENTELVDRWMKKMAQEAEAMNLANEK